MEKAKIPPITRKQTLVSLPIVSHLTASAIPATAYRKQNLGPTDVCTHINYKRRQFLNVCYYVYYMHYLSYAVAVFMYFGHMAGIYV
jgi:hypothetical protein